VENVKIRYVFKNEDKTKFRFMSIVAIENVNFSDIIKLYNSEGYELVSRDKHTGFKDKKSKEIYEGDIITCEYGMGNKGYKIVGDNGLHNFYYWWLEYMIDGRDVEKIGNKYENPELLKEENNE
jgi:hypothetical protein